jgi:DNA-binding LacI/PurR family transcriptional regulator
VTTDWLATLLERIRQPDLPPRQVLLAAELVQRRSSR